MVKDYGEILLESMSTLLNKRLQDLSQQIEETLAEEEVLLTTADPLINFLPNFNKTLNFEDVVLIKEIELSGDEEAVEELAEGTEEELPNEESETISTHSDYWQLTNFDTINTLLAIDMVLSTERVQDTTIVDEVKYLPVQGQFGLVIGIQTDLSQKVSYFTSNDMFGNIYNFNHMPQKVLINLPQGENVQNIAITAYNDAENLSFTVHSISLAIGQDLNEIGSSLEPFTISCASNDLQYSITEQGEVIDNGEANYVFEARYVGKTPEGQYFIIKQDNNLLSNLDVTVRWYQYFGNSATAELVDMWGGSGWKYLEGKDGFTFTHSNESLSYGDAESYKAVLVGSDLDTGEQICLTSNILSVNKEVIPMSGFINEIKLELQDGSKGNYPYYDYDNYINPSLMYQSAIERTALCTFKTVYLDEDGNPNNKFFEHLESIEWIYDSKSVKYMGTVIPFRSFIDSNGYTHEQFVITPIDPESDESKYDVSILTNLCSFKYTLPSYLNPNDVADKIECKFTFNDGKEYVATKSLTLTQRGNNGTDYTIVARLHNRSGQVVGAIYPEENATLPQYYISVNVYDPEGKHLDPNNLRIAVSNTTFKKLTYSGIEIDDEPRYWINQNQNLPLICEVTVRFSAMQETPEPGAQATGSPVERAFYLQDYVLVPVCGANYQSGFYKGPTKIVYNSEGTKPEYSRQFLEVIINGAAASLKWRYVSNLEDKYSSLNPEVTVSGDTYSFTPVGAYDARLGEALIYLQALDNSNNVVWNQPIKFIQNKHFSSIIDNWDGSLQIDEEGNYIMASAYVAGGKNEENKFTGLVMGELGTITETKDTEATVAEGEAEAIKPNYKNSHETAPTAKETGLFGYKEGAQSFGFRADGTAFIGPSGGGRINFDGNGGVIYSGNFDGFEFNTDGSVIVDVGTQGTYFSLQDGKLITSEGMFRGALGVEEGNLAGWKLDWSGLYKKREYETELEDGTTAYQYYVAGINSNTSVPIVDADKVFSYSLGTYYASITGATLGLKAATSWRIPHRINGKVVGGLELQNGNDWSKLPNLETIQFDSDISSLFIGDEFFKGNQSLRKIYIPASTYYIGSNAFADTHEDLEIYLEGGLNTRWASNWYGNKKSKIYYSSGAQDFDFSDIKFVNNPTQTKLIRFYAGMNNSNPSMEEWASLPANRSAFLVADSGETYITDLEVRRLKCSPPPGTNYDENPNILDFGQNSRIQLTNFNKQEYNGALSVSTQYTGDSIEYLGSYEKGFSINTSTKPLNFITSIIAIFVFVDSFPPFKTTAFEDFIAKAVICDITSGRASKIIPKTPIGQDFLVRIRPVSRVLCKRILPIGSSNLINSSIP